MTPQELKNSILQLAIQGKLVEQRPEEGTGEELYLQIQKVIFQEVSGKHKNKSRNNIIDILEVDLPYDIPDSWKWVRLGEIGYTNIGLTYSPQDMSEVGTIVLRSSNIQDGKMAYDDIVRVNLDIPKNKICNKGDILICARNGSKRLVGKAAIIEQDGMSFGAFMAIFRSICNGYILYVINSTYFRNSLLGDTGTTTINQITQDMLINALIPLPPLAEQRRIVAKIEELLPFIDRYEQAWSKLEDFNKRFPNEMQKSILQMAIQGKLVEQRQEEGTGEDLYQQIQAEKQRLIKDGTIRKEKPLSEIAEDEKPFDIPEIWKWAKLGALFSIERGSSPRPIQAYLTKSKDGVNWIKIGDSDAGAKYITSTSEKITQEGAKRSRLVSIGDFIISNSMSFGRPYIMAINGYVHDGWNIIHIIKLKNETEFNKDYLYYVLSSNLLVEQMKDKAAGGVVKNIRSDSLRELSIPIPPLAEQQRIVAKLEEILPYCEKLM